MATGVAGALQFSTFCWGTGEFACCQGQRPGRSSTITATASAERFEAQLLSDSGPIPVEVIVRNTEAEGAVRRIFAVRDLRERRAAEQRILYLAHFDTLTGLPNRASFQDRLENDIAAMKARNGELALMIIDLDRFKEINDVHGHAAGDELLKATAARITALLSHTEFAARLGGDEFVIVQTGTRPAGLGRAAGRQAAGSLLQADRRSPASRSTSA